MSLYFAYGLKIQSAWSLPELREVQGSPDVVVRPGEIVIDPAVCLEDHESSWVSEDGMNLRWRGAGSFLVRGGNEIIVDADPDAEESRIRLFLLGAAFGVLLHQRGVFALHASAVVVSGRAVLFIAPKGWGKSTLAATMMARGHALLADDIVPIVWARGGAPMGIAAFPQLKLWPDAITFLGHDPNAIPRISSLFEKRDHRVEVEFSSENCPLGVIIMLGEEDEPQLEKLTPQETLKALVVHSYSARFASVLLQGQQGARHFQQCAEIARVVPCYVLKRRNALNDMPLLATMIENLMTEILG